MLLHVSAFSRRLPNMTNTGKPPLVHAVTRVSAAGGETAGIRNGKIYSSPSKNSPTPGSDWRTSHRFFLTTPAVTNAMRRRFGCYGAIGLELAEDSFGISCEHAAAF